MKRALAGLGSALSYFTILPVGRFVPNAAPDPIAISFLPFIGAAVGALAGALGWFVGSHDKVWWPFVAWAASIVLTGALHIDGFLDCCDALFAPVAPARRLEILHDPLHGTFALTGMAVVTVVWLTAIARLPLTHVVLALAFSATVARIAAIANAWVFPYARPGSVTPAFVSRPNVAIVVLGALLAVAFGWWIDPLVAAIVPSAIAFSLAIGWWAARRLGGGLTGDVFGAVVVVVDVCSLVAIGFIAS